jgi:hypothetical protein
MLIRFYKRRIKKLRKLAVQPDVDLWALDEVHFQQHGSGCRMWVPPEVKEPVLLHAPTRKSVGYFGAVRLRDGKFILRSRRAKIQRSKLLGIFQAVTAQSLRSRNRVIIILDNAKYHHALAQGLERGGDACLYARLSATYSPELNPIERIWKLTRRLSCTMSTFPNQT